LQEVSCDFLAILGALGVLHFLCSQAKALPAFFRQKRRPPPCRERTPPRFTLYFLYFALFFVFAQFALPAAFSSFEPQ
jgi:hypothetical protein